MASVPSFPDRIQDQSDYSGTPADTYVLTWVQADGKFEPMPAPNPFVGLTQGLGDDAFVILTQPMRGPSSESDGASYITINAAPDGNGGGGDGDIVFQHTNNGPADSVAKVSAYGIKTTGTLTDQGDGRAVDPNNRQLVNSSNTAVLDFSGGLSTLGNDFSLGNASLTNVGNVNGYPGYPVGFSSDGISSAGNISAPSITNGSNPVTIGSGNAVDLAVAGGMTVGGYGQFGSVVHSTNAGDINADRGNGTGALYLGGSTIYYNGSTLNLFSPTAFGGTVSGPSDNWQLNSDGSIVATSATFGGPVELESVSVSALPSVATPGEKLFCNNCSYGGGTGMDVTYRGGNWVTPDGVTAHT